jgi:uncharacterized protein
LRGPTEGRRSLLGWRRAVGSDLPALSAFLRQREEARVGFTGRLLRTGPLGTAALRLPAAIRGAVWIAEAESAPAGEAPAILGAVLCHPSRLVFPIFPPEEGRDGGLALLASSFSPASIIGMEADVLRYEAALRLSPQTRVTYRLMARGGAERPALARAEGAGRVPVRLSGLIVRRATPADLDALLPLQEAYEYEEVLTPIHEFNAAACRASLARALERQLVFAAEEGGVLVGKAGTNARGFRVDQIGGVYTLPSRRGRGVAAALMEALLAGIEAEGRRSSLFVKETNLPALALYRGLGFEDIGSYRADYFEV